MIETVANRTTCRSATHCCTKKIGSLLFLLLFLFTLLIISTRVGDSASQVCVIVGVAACAQVFYYYRSKKIQRLNREQQADEIAAVDIAALEASEVAAALSAVEVLEGQDAVSVLEEQWPARQEAHDLAEALELSEVLAVVGALEESAEAGKPEP